MKYMGSKSRIAKHIVPIIQKYIDDNNIKLYVEPFVGGANVIDKIKCERKVGYDLNKYLIALLRHVKNDGKLYDEVTKEFYDKARESFKSGDTKEFEDWQIGNIGFLASYNGRFFDGGYAKSGYEKTKNGMRLRDYYRESKDNILKQSKSLKDIDFRVCDYSGIIVCKALIYCDPPYENTKKYRNAKDFNYEKFWNIVRYWSTNNIVIVSELEAPNDFKCIWEQEVSRSIKSKDKSKATEKLFIYKGE